jgi:hypothetical protein
MRRIGLAVVLTLWMKEDIMRMLSGFLALVDWPSNGRRRERGGGRVGHARPRFAWGPVDPWGPYAPLSSSPLLGSVLPPGERGLPVQGRPLRRA